MSDILTLSITSSVIYFMFKFLEMKYIEKEEKPVKGLIKDSFFVFLGVYISSVISNNLLSDINPAKIIAPEQGGTKIPAFTGNPEF